jgi:hypothetical protein
VRLHHAVPVLLCLFASACVAAPTAEDVDRTLEQTLSSVEGNWSGASYGSNLLTLNFQLLRGAGVQVSGSGSMKEASAPASAPITVTGTYARPLLNLTFSGMVFEGRAVQGTFQGDYITVGGVLATLRLTGTNYSRDIQVLLQEGM